MRQDKALDRAFFTNEFTAQDLGAAVTVVLLAADGLVTAAVNTVNPCMPRAVRLAAAGVHSACVAVNTAGNWTLRLRVNEAGADSATFTIGVAAVPGSKNAGPWSSDIILQPGDTYHLQADGPSRNVVLVRATLLWEVL